MLNKYKKIKNKFEEGYILAFALIVVAILLTVSLSISRIITKEIYFSRLIENGKGAYFAADAGLECAQYLDSVFKDDSIGVSLILNATTSSNGGQDFKDHATNYVFFATSTVVSNTEISNISNIFCSSDGGDNKIFNEYESSTDSVKENLFNSDSFSSFNIQGDANQATTTFGIIIKQKDSSGNDINRCALIEFAKTKSNSTTTTASFGIASTGYSSCNANDPTRVSRTIYRYSND